MTIILLGTGLGVIGGGYIIVGLGEWTGGYGMYWVLGFGFG